MGRNFLMICNRPRGCKDMASKSLRTALNKLTAETHIFPCQGTNHHLAGLCGIRRKIRLPQAGGLVKCGGAKGFLPALGWGPLRKRWDENKKQNWEYSAPSVFVKIFGWFLWFHGEFFHIHNETAQLSCVKNRAGSHPSMRFVARPTNISVSEIHKRLQNANPSIEEATKKTRVKTRSMKICPQFSTQIWLWWLI